MTAKETRRQIRMDGATIERLADLAGWLELPEAGVIRAAVRELHKREHLRRLREARGVDALQVVAAPVSAAALGAKGARKVRQG